MFISYAQVPVCVCSWGKLFCAVRAVWPCNHATETHGNPDTGASQIGVTGLALQQSYIVIYARKTFVFGALKSSSLCAQRAHQNTVQHVSQQDAVQQSSTARKPNCRGAPCASRPVQFTDIYRLSSPPIGISALCRLNHETEGGLMGTAQTDLD